MSILESDFVCGFTEYCAAIDVDWYMTLANPLKRLEHLIRFSKLRPDLAADLHERYGTLADVSQCIGENKALITCRIDDVVSKQIEEEIHAYCARV